jgi:hypothetical protein
LAYIIPIAVIAIFDSTDFCLDEWMNEWMDGYGWIWMKDALDKGVDCMDCADWTAWTVRTVGNREL